VKAESGPNDCESFRKKLKKPKDLNSFRYVDLMTWRTKYVDFFWIYVT